MPKRIIPPTLLKLARNAFMRDSVPDGMSSAALYF
jgi:hypothetical protein